MPVVPGVIKKSVKPTWPKYVNITRLGVEAAVLYWTQQEEVLTLSVGKQRMQSKTKHIFYMYSTFEQGENIVIIMKSRIKKTKQKEVGK